MSEAIDIIRKYSEKETEHIPDWVKQQIDDELLFGIPCPCVKTDEGILVFKHPEPPINLPIIIPLIPPLPPLPFLVWGAQPHFRELEPFCKLTGLTEATRPDWSARFTDAFPCW